MQKVAAVRAVFRAETKVAKNSLIGFLQTLTQVTDRTDLTLMAKSMFFMPQKSLKRFQTRLILFHLWCSQTQNLTRIRPPAATILPYKHQIFSSIRWMWITRSQRTEKLYQVLALLVNRAMATKITKPIRVDKTIASSVCRSKVKKRKSNCWLGVVHSRLIKHAVW